MILAVNDSTSITFHAFLWFISHKEIAHAIDSITTSNSYCTIVHKCIYSVYSNVFLHEMLILRMIHVNNYFFFKSVPFYVLYYFCDAVNRP